MTFTNGLESEIKLLICVESKASSGTPLCLILQTIKNWSNQIESEQPFLFTVYSNYLVFKLLFCVKIQ